MKNTFSVVLLLVCGVFGVTGEVKPVLVMEGDSVTLGTGITSMQKDDVVTWRVKGGEPDFVIVEIRKNKIPNVKGVRFRDRVQVNNQTGDLTINNMRVKHSGLYKAEISTNAGTTYKNFSVTVIDSSPYIATGDVKSVSVSVSEGESVTLNTDVQTHRDDLIVWRDRLKLDDQTGSLNITNFRTTDSGLYKLQISSNNKQTLHKNFRVFVSDPGLSAGQVTGIIFGVLLVIAVVGVFSYRRIKYEQQKQKVKEKMVEDKHSVNLKTGVTELQSDDVIEWMFRDEVIYRFSTDNRDKERLTDRLQVDDQTGSLTITDIRTADAGLYKVKMSSSSRVKSFLQLITGGGPSYSQLNVAVYVVKKVMAGDVFTLIPDAEIQSSDEIEWIFKDKDIKTIVDSMDNNLTLNETGSLTINCVNQNNTGLYKVKITSSKGTSYSYFKVIINGEIRTEFEGETVILETGFYKLPKETEIQWMFDNEVIISGGNSEDNNTISEYNGDDKRFQGKLELNNIDGYLSIGNIETRNKGLYKVRITTNEETSFLHYSVHVIDILDFARLFQAMSDEVHEEKDK
ncbi:uncharacterized protein LOC130548429 isoform X2 [Triplophysa rosa]|uniref:uncharacterized protein LOC130548429 isoform X2 n=1 Tax=Triplophysa rosa TaxID=992332 RepID=UPI002545CBAF|nr:uncharacterized protein LOC130548429 isoform X2 [Triplophysa rosa]